MAEFFYKRYKIKEKYINGSHLAATKAEPARHHDKATPFATGKVGYNTIRHQSRINGVI